MRRGHGRAGLSAPGWLEARPPSTARPRRSAREPSRTRTAQRRAAGRPGGRPRRRRRALLAGRRDRAPDGQAGPTRPSRWRRSHRPARDKTPGARRRRCSSRRRRRDAPARTGEPARAAGSGLGRPSFDLNQRLVDQPGSRSTHDRAPQIPSAAAMENDAGEDRRAGGTALRSASASRSWLQSSVARSVCCRSSAVRLPAGQQAEAVVQPRGDLRRRVSAVTRAAASSSASGMPSSRRQISATAAAFSAVEREAGRGVARRARRTAAPPRSGRPASGGRRRGDGHRQRRHPPGDLAARCRSGSRLVARIAQPRAAARAALGQRGAGREQVLAVVQHQQQRARRRAARPEHRAGRPLAALGTPSAAAICLRHQRRVGQRRQLDQPDAVREVGGATARRPRAPAASCRTRPVPVSVSSRVRASGRRSSATPARARRSSSAGEGVLVRVERRLALAA